MAAAISPSSSPRLPSPPPIAEDQIGPTSPGISLYDDHGKLPNLNNVDAGPARRIRPGTKAEDMAEGPPLVELQEIDSAFQLTEHLKATHYALTHPQDSLTVHAINTDIARRLAEPPPHTSKDIWLYELGRFLIQQTNTIIVALFADEPSCSSHTCPEMRASEWQYLCAVHDPPKSCAAIDYCCHTLDWAATLLASSKMFPSRLGLGSGNGATGTSDKTLQQQMKEIKNIFRRVYRIYAHAWFQHREVFWRVESKTGLYVLFKTVCKEYGIIESENYTIPAEAEGAEPSSSRAQWSAHSPGVSVLPREQNLNAGQVDSSPDFSEPVGNETVSRGDTTKRHRLPAGERPSSIATVIQEVAEEDDEQLEEKPKLDRSDTAHKGFEKGFEPVEGDKENDKSLHSPRPSIGRNDTMKASDHEDSTFEVDEEEEAEQTVLEVESEFQSQRDSEDTKDKNQHEDEKSMSGDSQIINEPTES